MIIFYKLINSIDRIKTGFKSGISTEKKNTRKQNKMNWKNVIIGVSRFSLIFTFSPIAQKFGATEKKRISNSESASKNTLENIIKTYVFLDVMKLEYYH